jgi:hypothetical protein
MKWVDHVKAYASNKGITYRQALKDSECKETYHKQKGEQKEVDKGNKEFNKRQSTKKLINFGEETIEIPREMALNNNPVETLTKNHTPRRRKIKGQIQPSINLEPIDGNEIRIVSENKTDETRHNEFKDDLKTRVKARRTLKKVFPGL